MYAIMAAGMLTWIGTSARNTNAGTRMTPPMPMHPIIRPDVIPSKHNPYQFRNSHRVTPPLPKNLILMLLCTTIFLHRIKRGA